MASGFVINEEELARMLEQATIINRRSRPVVDVEDILTKMQEVIDGKRSEDDVTKDEIDAAIFQSRSDNETLVRFAKLIGLTISEAEFEVEHCPTCNKRGNCPLELMAAAFVESIPPRGVVTLEAPWEERLEAIRDVMNDQRRTSEVSNEVFSASIKEAIQDWQEISDDSKLQQLVDALKITADLIGSADADPSMQINKPMYRPILDAARRRYYAN